MNIHHAYIAPVAEMRRKAEEYYGMKSKIEKMAQEDAERYLSAEMFYGEGAGIRRRHMDAEVITKQADPEYYDAFEKAYQALDLDKFAKMAIKERQKIDRINKTSKNLRALKNGNLRGVSTGLFYLGAAGYVAHVTGYDKVVLDEAKKLYKKAKTEVKYRKARWQGKNVTKLA